MSNLKCTIMKKNVFLVLSIIIGLFSCSKTENNEKSIQKSDLKTNVKNIVSVQLNSNEFIDLTLSNCNNPYDFIGIITRNVSNKFLKKIYLNKTDTVSILNDFEYALKAELPESFIFTDSTNIDELETEIENMLTDIYVNQGYDNFVIKSKKIEDIITTSNYFNEDQKKRVLIFSSVIRHDVGLFREFFSNSKVMKPTWEECMKAKLTELDNCNSCILEKIHCALNWPVCFGIKAVDCLIATL